MRFKKTLFLVATIILLSGFMYSQKVEIKKDTVSNDGFTKNSGIIFGGNISKYPAIEVGYTNLSYLLVKFPIIRGYSIGIENYFINEYILAPKISAWTNMLLNFGCSMVWYTNLNGENSLKLRPEIGFGYVDFRVNFAYNISIYNKHMPNITNAMLSLNYIIPFKKIND